MRVAHSLHSRYLKPAAIASAFVAALSYGRVAHASGIAGYWDSSAGKEFVFFMDTSWNLQSVTCKQPACWVQSQVVPFSFASSGTQMLVDKYTTLTSYYDGSQGHLFFQASPLYGGSNDWIIELKGSPPSSLDTLFNNLGLFSSSSAMWDGSIGHLFFTDGSSNLQERWFNGTWNSSTLPQCTSKLAGGMTSYWDGSVEHVVFQFTDLNGNPGLCETYHSGSTWSTGPIAGGGGNGPAPNGVAVSGAAFRGTQNVLGVSTTQNALVLTTFSPWTSSTIPANVNLFSQTLVFTDSKSYLYFFVGANGHLFELLNPGSIYEEILDFSTSNFGDGSTVAIANAHGDLVGFFDGTYDHVFYVGSDGNVHEYYAKPSGAWTGHAITSGSPALI